MADKQARSHPWSFSNRQREDSADQDRWMAANYHLETMEGEQKENVGITETGGA